MSDKQYVLFSYGEYSDFRIGTLVCGPVGQTMSELVDEFKETYTSKVLRATYYDIETRKDVVVSLDRLPQDEVDQARDHPWKFWYIKIPGMFGPEQIHSYNKHTYREPIEARVAWQRDWSEARLRLIADGFTTTDKDDDDIDEDDNVYGGDFYRPGWDSSTRGSDRYFYFHEWYPEKTFLNWLTKAKGFEVIEYTMHHNF